MQVITNKAHVTRQQKLLRRTVFLGFVLLTGSVLTIFLGRELVYLAWPLMIAGYMVSGISRQIQFDWGPGARADHRLASALKPLSNRYCLMSYVPSGSVLVDHLLIGPEGILVIEARNHPGLTTCSEGRWTRRVGLFARIFAREPRIGEPEAELARSVEATDADLAAAGITGVDVRGAVVFTAPDAVLDVDSCPATVLTIGQLGAWAASRRGYTGGLVSDALRQRVIDLFKSRLPEATVAEISGR